MYIILLHSGTATKIRLPYSLSVDEIPRQFNRISGNQAAEAAFNRNSVRQSNSSQPLEQ